VTEEETVEEEQTEVEEEVIAEENEVETEENIEEATEEELNVVENEEPKEMFDHEDMLDVSVEFNDACPVFGTIATLKASTVELNGIYLIQWQYSIDNENWIDIEGENSQVFPVEITADNYMYYWRAVARYNDEDMLAIE